MAVNRDGLAKALWDALNKDDPEAHMSGGVHNGQWARRQTIDGIFDLRAVAAGLIHVFDTQSVAGEFNRPEQLTDCSGDEP